MALGGSARPSGLPSGVAVSSPAVAPYFPALEYPGAVPGSGAHPAAPETLHSELRPRVHCAPPASTKGPQPGHRPVLWGSGGSDRQGRDLCPLSWRVQGGLPAVGKELVGGLKPV